MSKENHVLFLFDNAVQQGTISASSEASSDFAASNMLDPTRSKIWRSADGGNSAYFDMVIPAKSVASVVALVDPNVTTTGDIRVQAWSDSIGGSDLVVDITENAWRLLEGYGLGGYGISGYGGLPTSKTLDLIRPVALIGLEKWMADIRYWRITLTDPATSYKECSVPFIGRHFQPSTNINWLSSKSLEYRTKVVESRGGQRYGNSKRPRTILVGELEDLPPNESDFLWLRHLEFGNNRPFIVSFKPDNSFGQLFQSIYGTFHASEQVDQYLNARATQLKIEETL